MSNENIQKVAVMTDSWLIILIATKVYQMCAYKVINAN